MNGQRVRRAAAQPSASQIACKSRRLDTTEGQGNVCGMRRRVRALGGGVFCVGLRGGLRRLASLGSLEVVERIDCETSRFTQEEAFSGVLVPFVGFDPYIAGWRRMNSALKARAEAPRAHNQ